jgi:hypothetical protein
MTTTKRERELLCYLVMWGYGKAVHGTDLSTAHRLERKGLVVVQDRRSEHGCCVAELTTAGAVIGEAEHKLLAAKGEQVYRTIDAQPLRDLKERP